MTMVTNGKVLVMTVEVIPTVNGMKPIMTFVAAFEFEAQALAFINSNPGTYYVVQATTSESRA